MGTTLNKSSHRTGQTVDISELPLSRERNEWMMRMPGLPHRVAGASPGESGAALGDLGSASADVGCQRVRLLLEQLRRSADIDSGTGALEQHHRRAPTTGGSFAPDLDDQLTVA